MTLFTKSPLEKLMQEVPSASGRTSPPTAPPDHYCFGCANYGQGCVAPCYRELLKYLDKERKKK